MLRRQRNKLVDPLSNTEEVNTDHRENVIVQLLIKTLHVHKGQVRRRIHQLRDQAGKDNRRYQVRTTVCGQQDPAPVPVPLLLFEQHKRQRQRRRPGLNQPGLIICRPQFFSGNIHWSKR
ncbi:hypothetical protein [Wenzhouxiangella sp. XN24]|uniref:hypothetical protein n=1 Tax=Wenzhouxiangella sp. XN24 TaxID=2713569 RepID=UPI001F102826|nr:hypothetical protein [Wenzhouxiangella sp. XN24]